MGVGASRIDKLYATHEKAFEKLENDLQRLHTRRVQRQKRRSTLNFWFGAATFIAVAIAAVVVYKVQNAPPGTYTPEQHLRIGLCALLTPAACFLLDWIAAELTGWIDGRDARRMKKLEDYKRALVKELKDMSRYDKTRELILKYDPDARQQPQPPGRLPAGAQGGGPRAPPPHAPPPGGAAGNVAGAAVSAVAGAGRALVPLFDKLAQTLISDNPVLLDDLRSAQGQLAEADAKVQAAFQESSALRAENLGLRERVAELEALMGLPPSVQPLAAQPKAGSGGGSVCGEGAGAGEAALGPEDSEKSEKGSQGAGLGPSS